MAEVLITLAIIGIVAALTIPSVMANYKRHELQTQFKKAYNTISQAGMQMRAEGAVKNFKTTDIAQAVSFLQDIDRNYYRYFKVIKRLPEVEYDDDDNALNLIDYSNYFGDKKWLSSGAGSFSGEYNGGANLTDGSWIKLDGNPHCNLYGAGGGTVPSDAQCFIYVTVDINGIDKKPNRVGYDVFLFEILTNGSTIPVRLNGGSADFSVCKTSAELGTSGLRKGQCLTSYALADKSPEDLSKKYFKNLKF